MPFCSLNYNVFNLSRNKIIKLEANIIPYIMLIKTN